MRNNKLPLNYSKDWSNDQHYQRAALLTVSDLSGMTNFTKGLAELNFKLIVTQKVADVAKAAGVSTNLVHDFTGMPHLVGPKGIKIIDSRLFAGVLADPNNHRHAQDLVNHQIQRIEIVACNFYKFTEFIQHREANHEKILQNIDIGGPAIVRCAAKNYRNVFVIVDPIDYQDVLDALNSNRPSDSLRFYLAKKAFEAVHLLDEAIIKYLNGYSFHERVDTSFLK